ncbi:MAG: Hpt domain-containing protein [Desulfamplus sp.]|nr:Hpt domain-containing protein [Desulfamplus sp.]
MDFEHMASEIGIDREDFIELAEMLVDVSNNDMAQFEQAAAQGDLKKAAMAAHSIKGAAANLGFMEIAKAAETLEKSAKAEDTSEFEEKSGFIKDQLDIINKALAGYS